MKFHAYEQPQIDVNMQRAQLIICITTNCIIWKQYSNTVNRNRVLTLCQ